MSDLLRRSAVLGIAIAALCSPIRSPEHQTLSGIPDNVFAGEIDLASAAEATTDPLHFSQDELKLLERRFGVHGPQHRLAQLVTSGVDRIEPVRSNTLAQLRQLKPVILRQSRLQRVNPMLVTVILFDEIQHSKPGEGLPFIAHSGLVRTLGPAQLGITELIHQQRLRERPSALEVRWARNQLLNPAFNVEVLVGKIHRLKGELELRTDQPLNASRSIDDAKAIATLAYLHNGKLDYPTRVLSYMQDPALHGLIYSSRRSRLTTLI